MPYVVTQSCCSDASCVFACPVNCIHPTPDEPDFATAEMLYVDPAACVDCGACVAACPVDAIMPHTKLAPAQQQFLSINADFYRTPRARPTLAPVTLAPAVARDREPLRVAIVGSGPAAMYAADELLTQPDVSVHVLDRLPTPYGLVRAGVAPDHQHTKQVTALFDRIGEQRGFRYFLNVSVPEHVTHEDLLEHHHAVIYAVGASADRRLGVPGADLDGCGSATDFVAWYNGHPDHAARNYDLASSRAVIIGNGNVALDVARVLTASPDALASTDIASHALAALRSSRIEEVVIVGRRGLAQSAFTVPEFVGLLESPEVDVLLDAPDGAIDETTLGQERAGTLEHSVAWKLQLLRSLPRVSDAPAGGKRIVLRYLAAPVGFVGDRRVNGVELAATAFTFDHGAMVEPTGAGDVLEAGLVLSSIGYRGVAVAGLPFDETTGVIPNESGRVPDRPGAYVAGWIKRGPTGFIGTNKSCSQETVRALVADFNDGLLPEPAHDPGAFGRLVRSRRPAAVTGDGWRAIDAAERERGAAEGRPRSKVTDVAELVELAGRPRRRTLRR
ncbi:MAG: FAD-dependent oxidoreductase [Jatrophihabitans sp.]